MSMRSHFCGKINEQLVGQKVQICGWVHRFRNHGGIMFINLRDLSGIVQVVIDQKKQPELFALAENLSNETVIGVIGVVRYRPVEMQNKDMPTGMVEVVGEELIIFSKAEPLPIPVAEEHDVDAELRLQYRYLDLRRPAMAKNIMLRAKAAKVLRKFLDEHGFLEIETPVLTKATPEGARDYLVPSRVHPGKFYALPQSPQIFKQLLMVSGLDRYYQIVRCFRDEDLRADRQPEFTQLDIETSFLTQEELYAIIEDMLRVLFKETINVDLPNPFPRLTYAEAMRRFGSDKPDLRIAMELVDIIDLVKNSQFKVFVDTAKAAGRIAALRVPGAANLSRKDIEQYENVAKKYGAKGLVTIKVLAGGVQSSIAKFLTNEEMKAIVARVAAQNGDMIFCVADTFEVASNALGNVRLKVAHDFKLATQGWQPLWVVDFPMFMKTDDGGLTFMHHPFTAPIEKDPAKVRANPESCIAQAYDLVMNGSELGGGSMRIYDAEMQKTIFNLIGIDNATAEKQFGHLLTAFKYGCPPHGGIAFGFDRIVMLLAGADSLREVIAFPKTQTATCPLTHAPSEVSEAQLRELHILTKKT